MGLSLDAVADDLYGGDPADFVARRDAAAKAARAAGDRALAGEIAKLRRPSLAAWYVNVAARASLVSLVEWLALGEDLRAAQTALDGARVRDLSGRRTKLEARVVGDLVAHLGALGVTASGAALDEVRTTLRAALADPAASAAVASGRLTRALSYAGFGEVDLTEALAAMTTAPAPTGLDPSAPDASAPALPNPELVAARERAAAAVVEAEAAASVAEERLGSAEADVTEAERQLRLATTRHTKARTAADTAAASLTAAQEELARAEAALT